MGADMLRLAPLALIAALMPPPAVAETAVPGLAGAVLRPGWVTPRGTRMVAVEIDLQPGWKTYWRAPGDAGIPPMLDWSGSANAGAVVLHWPAPEVIDSGGVHTLGFHDRLLLPVEVAPVVPGQPVDLTVALDFGLCREVCVPAHVTLTAPPPGPGPDPLIEAALATVPRPVSDRPACRMAPIADGIRLTAALPPGVLPGPDPDVAMELTGTGAAVWVSAPERAPLPGGGMQVAADFVPPQAAPFALDPAGLRLTLIGPGGAVEMTGCR